MISIPQKVAYNSHVTCAQWEALRACWEQILAQKPDVLAQLYYRYSYSSETFSPSTWPTQHGMQCATNAVYSYAIGGTGGSAGLASASNLGATSLRTSRDPNAAPTVAKVENVANLPINTTAVLAYNINYQMGCVVMTYGYLEP